MMDFFSDMGRTPEKRKTISKGKKYSYGCFAAFNRG
jgi:hypothetical protein